MCASAEVRDVTTCQSSDWRLDPVLQPEAPSSGAEDENPGTGLCPSRLVVQEQLGHYLVVGWLAAAQLVLPKRQGSAQGSGASGYADQGHDRGESILRLSNRGGTAGLQQEHSTAHLPAQGVASPQAPGRVSPTDPGLAIGGVCPKPALGDRPMPDLGWTGWLVLVGLGD